MVLLWKPTSTAINPTAILGDGVEGFGGGIFTFALYHGVLCYLTTERGVRAGEINRAQQFNFVRKAVWEATKGSAVAIGVVSVVLALFPAITPIAGLAGIAGFAIAGTRLVNEAMVTFSPEQRAVLKQKADEAGVSIAGLTDVTDDGTSTAGAPA